MNEYITIKEVAAEMARRKVQFHPDKEWKQINNTQSI